MTALLLDPHGDDAVLFACFTLLRERPNVIVCLRSQLQEQRGGPTYQVRERETAEAFGLLGIKVWEQWHIPDSKPDWVAVKRLMEEARDGMHPDRVFVPCWEVGGHEHHNAITEIASEVFGIQTLTRYLTYERGSARSDWAKPVHAEPAWIALKHRAMACFTSQIELEATRPWFMAGLREWVA